jgi:hypothetical protein
MPRLPPTLQLALAALAPAFSAAVLAAGFYVPPEQGQLDACRQAAAAQFHGEVLFSSVRTVDAVVSVRLYLGSKGGGKERVVVCDGAPGRISKVISIDD